MNGPEAYRDRTEEVRAVSEITAVRTLSILTGELLTRGPMKSTFSSSKTTQMSDFHGCSSTCTQ